MLLVSAVILNTAPSKSFVTRNWQHKRDLDNMVKNEEDKCNVNLARKKDDNCKKNNNRTCQ